MESYIPRVAYPINYEQQLNAGKKMWDLLYPGVDYPKPKQHIYVVHNGPFETYTFSEKGSSFYRSLSMVIFGEEKGTSTLKKAIRAHGIKNKSHFAGIFSHDKPKYDKSSDLSSYLDNMLAGQIEASYIDAYIAAHLFEVPIVLFPYEDVTTPLVFLPNTYEKEEYPDTAILLSIEPIGHTHTYIFKPILSYTRPDPTNDIEMMKTRLCHNNKTPSPDSSTENEYSDPKEYSITLIANDDETFISILFCFMKKHSSYLAQFCGGSVQTDLSPISLKKLHAYIMRENDKPDSYIDPQLYEFSKLWVMTSLFNTIESELKTATIGKLAEFCSSVNLLPNTSLYKQIRQRLFESKVADLEEIRILPRSKVHMDLNEFVAKLLCCRRGLNHVRPTYQAPHVVIALDTNNTCFGKYYNGEIWNSLFVPDIITEVMPYLKDNKYCVSKERLYFLKDSRTLGFVNLLGELSPSISFISIPEGCSNPQVAATTDPNLVLVMSDESKRMVCKVYGANTGKVHVSEWTHLSPDEYSLRFIGKDAIVYTVENVKCVQSTLHCEDKLFGVSSINGPVYCYDFRNVHPVERVNLNLVETIHIPKPDGVNLFLLFPTKALSEYIAKSLR